MKSARHRQLVRCTARLFLPMFILTAGASCLVKPVCYNDADCANHQTCHIAKAANSGHCRDLCKADSDCSRGQVCDPGTGRCLEGDCETDRDCPAGFACRGWRCISVVPLRCAGDMAAVENQFCIDLYEASRSDATDMSDGSDNSIATSRSGVRPWRVDNNAQALAACQAAGKTLCSGRQWYMACRGPSRTNYSYGNSYSAQTCNGIDSFCRCDDQCREPCPYPHCYHDCGAQFGLRPTAFLGDCSNGYGVFDINGNLWEHVLDGDDRRVRGGAYNCSNSELFHRCDYIPTTWSPSAKGFRCCNYGLPPLVEDAGPSDAHADATREAGTAGETGVEQ